MNHDYFKNKIEWQSFKEPNTGCWLWLGSTNGNGYARIWFCGSIKYAHRASYEAFIGKINHGLMVCHSCDNRCCVNPKHLFLGTAKENTADSIRKGRFAKGEKKSRLTVRDVLNIRSGQGSLSAAQLAAKYKVSRAAIDAIWSRRNWVHVS